MKVEKINSAYNCRKDLVLGKKAQAGVDNSPLKNITEISNICYKPISFGRTIQEHRSWGGRIDPKTKEVSFKMFTFPDAKGVDVLISKENEEEPLEIPMENKGKGVFEVTNISPDIVKNGDRYQFKITKSNDETEIVKDPYSFKQEELNGASTLYDQSEYKWKYDEAWKKNPNRITRTSNGKDGHKNVRECRIYAVSPDTISDERSYEGVIPKLKKIKRNGFNTLEVMHVENACAYNWGYDGVDKSSPSKYLGGPDQLKNLVDSAHKEGLNVVFDVIPNHIGPDGNQLSKTGPYIKGPNDFGDAFNFEGDNSEHVRDYIVNSMMNWVDNYHVDGLRLDMTKYMESDYTLKNIAADLNYHFPDCFTIAEDSRENVGLSENDAPIWNDESQLHDKRVTNKLRPEDYGEGKSEAEHANVTKKIFGDYGGIGRLGMDSEWDFSFHHRLDDMFYDPKNTDDMINTLMQGQHAVKYVMSHDEIGNHEGTRKIAKAMVPKLELNQKLYLNDDDKKRTKEFAKLKKYNPSHAEYIVSCQKEQLAAEDIAIKFQTGELDKYKTNKSNTYYENKEINDKLQKEVLDPWGIPKELGITYSKIQRAYDKAYNQTKMAQAFTFGIPGPKMVFQGDEKADLTPFRFFREFESVPVEDYLYVEKGYKPAEDALEASTMGQLKYSKQGLSKMKSFEKLTKDLNKVNEKNSALRLGYINGTHTVNHHGSSVVGLLSEDFENGNKVYTVTNFSDFSYDKDYEIQFPEGKWKEVINTENSKYGGQSKFLNEKTVESDGKESSKISLGGYSTLIFERVG